MKRLLFIFLLSCISLTSFSQGAPDPHFGVKGGINFSNVGGESNSFTVDPTLGIYGVYFINYFWHIQVDLSFSPQGHAATSGSDGKLNTNYLILPIMAGYSPNYNLNFHLGPQIGFLLGANTTFGGENFDVKDQLKSTDVGLVFDVTYYFFEKRLGASARYTHGLTNFNDSTGGNRFNRVIALTASWRLVVLD